MSVKVSSWVWGLETLTDNAPLLVLLALADAANDEGYCWHNQKTLCKKSRQSESTARRALRKLEAMGLVTTFRRMTSKGLASNLYLLNVGAEPDHTLQSDQSVTLNVPEGATIDEVIAEVERYRLFRMIPRPVKMTGGGSGQNDRGVPTDATFPHDSATGQNDRRGHDDWRGAVTYDGTPRSQVTGPYKEEPSYEPSLMNQTLPNPPQPPRDPVRSGAIQDDLSAHGSADADAEAATARGELAAEMLAAGENPASLVAEGWWNAGQLAEALAWAAEHPASARAPEIAQKRQEVAPQAAHQERGHVDEASALIGACLPEWMQAMDRTGARQVAGMLAERIAAGWTPAQIRSLMGEKPANGVRRMSSLVAYRLDQNAGIADAPQARTAAARQAQEAAIDAARQAQAAAIKAAIDAAKTPEERAREEAHRRMWERMRAAHPQASKAELVALVRDAFAAPGTALA
ncbi:helix-turn-helix domain-containing protein [Actinomyces bouchesdurhonensis]|uniref:helix-turn-helix domain-containing protein n=1 Tax=Actinomyces bouchesdurhonensis TaxID=1852361 RepID=UPI003C712A34